MNKSAQSGVFYGWVIVAVSFISLTIVLGTRFSFGIFYISILDETGWPRAATAGIFSVSMLTYAVVSLGVGAAFDRLGPRRMFPLAALLLGTGFVLSSRITTLWQFYLYYGVVVGAGFAALGFVPHVSLISRWFVRKRGLASSLALSGQGVGTLVLAPICAYLIATFGWRQSFLIYALLIGLLIPVMLIWHRDSPASLGLQPDGDVDPAQVKMPERPAEAMPGAYLHITKTRAFWALFTIVFSLAFNHMTLIVHQNQYLVDIGFKPEFAAWMLGFSGILRSGGTIIWGSVSDRITRETSLTISALLGVMALPCLIWAQTASSTWFVVLFVLLMGLGYGGVSVVYAASAADLYQGPHFGKILGLLDIGFGFGAALGTYMAGLLFDWLQSYHLTFYLIMVSIGISIACIWIAAPRRIRASSNRVNPISSKTKSIFSVVREDDSVFA
ncbi:MFS transporter, partial [Candidatus Entotheonella palauensis]